MVSGLRRLALLVPALLVAGCPDDPNLIQPEIDAGGIECALGQVARYGKCLCVNDTGCASGQYCDAVTGECKPKQDKPGPDAGQVGCTPGARRCAPAPAVYDGGRPPGAIQECQAGKWVDVETCPAEGYCAAAASGYYCAVCTNGRTRCKDATTVEVCSEKGDTWEASTCPNDPMTGQPSKCENDRCQSCVPNTARCTADGKSLETCLPDGSGWGSRYCAITGQCVVGPAAGADAGVPSEAHCVPPVCMPDERRCKAGTTVVLEICKQDGLGWTERDCTNYDQFATAKAVCQNNDCYEPCATAARESSYLGCEYWASVTPNIPGGSGNDLKAFTGNATFGTQPTTTSEYAIVVSNPNPVQAKVKVTRSVAGAEVTSPSSPAADANGDVIVPANSLQTIRLPWQMIGGTDSQGYPNGTTGKMPFAYHVTSDIPVSAYQFSPVTSKTGQSYSYSNDASLLLPAHILSNQYVVIAQEHITSESDSIFGGTQSVDYPAFMSVVATQANTQVTIRFASATEGGGGLGSQAINSSATYTLNKFDVLQFISATGGTKVCQSTPDYSLSGISRFCKWPSDPTGSIVSTDKPVAVFGGALCTVKPYYKLACDHVEEQMIPFQNWGKSYAGVKAAFYRGSGGKPVAFPTASPDYWRVIGGCGKASCPNGTKITITPAPDAFSQPLCAGCTCSGGTCTMPGIDTGKPAPWIEFTAGSATNAGNFVVSADQPIAVAQYFTGEDANSGSTEGDPALILIPPIEQWRTNYNVLASPTLVHNYISLVTQSATPGIQIDGKDVATFNPETAFITGGYAVYRVPVTGGPHVITAKSKVGVTVYGYDSYVSYGYTGGLDLLRITQIVPGG